MNVQRYNYQKRYDSFNRAGGGRYVCTMQQLIQLYMISPSTVSKEDGRGSEIDIQVTRT